MARRRRFAISILGSIAALWAWAGLVFVMDRAADAGEVVGRAEFAGVPLAGLSRAEALAAIRSAEVALGTETITVTIQGVPFTLVPAAVGFDLDEEGVVDAALRIGRGGGFFEEMRWWVTNPAGGATRELAVQASYDRDAVLDLLRQWEDTAIDDPPLEGGIAVEGDTLVPLYPESGTGLDFEATADLIGAAILGLRRPVEAVTEFRTPSLTAGDIDRAVERARELTAGAVTLDGIAPGTAITFPPHVLRRAIATRITPDPDGKPTLEVFFQIGPLAEHLGPLREYLEVPARDARVSILPGDVPTVVPGAFSREVEDARVPEAVLAAAESVTRRAALPMRDGNPPELTTEEAGALGIRSLLYTATTYFMAGGDPINQNRVHNIQRIAAEVNGALVLPGEVFSLNDHVGERTLEDGYLPAKAVVYRGALIGRVVYCCDHPANIGGGVSQFATTLYNAIWWAGLEDVEHTPHSIYFTRYPMVREATLGYPTPDVRFRNNTPHGILLTTEYTENSVTVKVFGDNGGITVEGETSPRRWFEQPYVYYEADRSLAPGVEEIRAEGTAGFTADVTRTITHPDGTKQVDVWTWTYDPNPTVIGVHPCSLPEEYPGHESTCPVEVPALVGMSSGQASGALTALGLAYAEGDPYPVTDPSLVGVVMAQNPAPGTWLAVGSAVTVRLGVLAGP